MTPISRDIQDHYAGGREAGRLATGRGELERVRTEAILRRYLPPPPAAVLDVGGAAGVYAIPLAQSGYVVELIDPMELHVAQARDAATSAGVQMTARVGDARRLDVEPGTADAVLLLGPLYHLQDHDDRLLALREACRALKPRGVLFAAGISRFASLIDGVASDLFRDPAFQEIVAGDLASGRHENPTNHPDYFTTAYFHRPEELQEELYAAGFAGVQVLAVEGPIWSASHFEKSWNDPSARSKLLQHLERIEREPSILGASAHLLSVARRPE